MSGTSSITAIAIQGKDQKRFKDKLVELLQLNSSSDVSCLTIAAENGGNSGQASFDPENSIIFNGVSSPSTNQALESLLSKCTGCSILEEKFQELKLDVEKLQEAVNEPKNNMQMSANVNNFAETERLRELLQEQKSENAMLREKIAQLQNERDSLTTVIRILNEESSKTAGKEDEFQLIAKSACEIKTAISSHESDWKTVSNKMKKTKAKKKGKQTSKKDNRESSLNENTVLIGDSIIKNIQAWKLSKSANRRVQVKSFPGAKVADFKHYLKPTLDQNPKEIILHIGTNDLRGVTAKKTAEDIVDIATWTMNECPDSIVSISELTTRNDRQDLAAKIQDVNKTLKKFATQHGWGYISHQNIDASCLNGSRLHLSDKGSGLLATNIISHLKTH